jgi:hypothetical protein
MTTTATIKKLKGFRTLVLLLKVRLNAKPARFPGDKRAQLRNFAINMPGKKRFSPARAEH